MKYILCMENTPIDLFIIMLGTNDVKNRFGKDPWDIGWGIDLLLSYVKKAGCGIGGGTPEILIASPIHLSSDWGESLHHTVFSEQSIEKSKKLAEIYEFIAEKNQCHFIDASLYASAVGDGIHMSAEGHGALGKAMAKKVKEIIG